MITGAQVRAARALIGWTARKLAQEANIPDHTLEWIEGEGKLTDKDHKALAVIRAALEDAGIEFIASIGVQLRPRAHLSSRSRL